MVKEKILFDIMSVCKVVQVNVMLKEYLILKTYIIKNIIIQLIILT